MARHWRFAWWMVSVLCSPALCGEPEGGRAILTEESAWRAHMTWGPSLRQAGGALEPLRLYRQLKSATEPPAQDWAACEFADGAWGLWRETHVTGTLAGTNVPLYDTRQYGIQQSEFVRRLCLRGRFEVTDPAGVRGLRLTAVYRGGLAARLNGREVGRANLSGEAAADPLGSADAYPKEVYADLSGKPWGLKSGSIGTLDLKEGPALERFNLRMRKLVVDIPASALRKGTNVLALDLRAAPVAEGAGAIHDWWSACGLASVELRGDGAVIPAVNRPAGTQVWTASPLFKVSPFGGISGGRISQGTIVHLYNYPLCWTASGEGTGVIRMVGARNGVFCGQAVVSSAAAIRGLKAEAGDLVRKGGGGTIPAANCQVSYMSFPSDPPARLTDVPVSLMDMLCDRPAPEIAALPATRAKSTTSVAGGVSWCEGGATAPVWLRVRVPGDAREGEYAGSLTVSAEGLQPTAVPVSLKVHGYALPDPRDFTAKVALVHSPETLALRYKAPMWSDQHFALMDRTCAYMGKLGGSVVFIPLIADTWLGNSQPMVGAGPGGGTADFNLFDRYLDMVQKHMKPRAVILYVNHSRGKGGAGLTADAWKPVIAETLARLKQRGMDECVTLGLTLEGGAGADMQPVVDMFKAAWPEGRWADWGHYGARRGSIGGVPYGFTMSVWGNQTPFKSRKWGQPDLPLVVLKHFRADPVIDLRPIASRGSLYWAAEQAMNETQGIGPLGMDFWNFPAGEGGRREPGPLERYITVLSMHMFSAAALLAPGPEGPVPTARMEVFRQGLQISEARAAIERARESGKLGGDLARRCEEVLRRRADVYHLLWCAERHAQGEGWRWFESGKWEELTDELFSLAGEVAAAAAAGTGGGS